MQPVLYVILGFILFRSTVFAWNHFLIWDEAVFFGMGRWIYSGGEVGIWEMIRPPGLPALFGIGGSIMFAEIVMLLFGSGCIYLTYIITKRLYTKRAAVIASGLLAVTPIFIEGSIRLMTGVHALFFCLLGLHLLLIKKDIWSGIAVGVAFVFRYPAGLMILPLLLLSKKKYKTVIAFGAVVLGYLVKNQIIYGSMFGPLIEASFHQSTIIGDKTGFEYLLFYPIALLMMNPGFVAGFFGRWKKEVVYPFLVFFFYFTFIPHKQERFALLFLPYLAMFAAVPISRLKKSIILLLVIFALPVFFTYHGDITSTGDIKHYGSMDGLVLTSDPVYAVYSDAKFVHFYDDPVTANNVIDEYIDKADIIIYNPDSFPWDDPESLKQKSQMIAKIESFGSRETFGRTEIYRRDS